MENPDEDRVRQYENNAITNWIVAISTVVIAFMAIVGPFLR